MQKPAVSNSKKGRTDKATVLQKPCVNLPKAKANINHFSLVPKREPELLQQLQQTNAAARLTRTIRIGGRRYDIDAALLGRLKIRKS